MGEIVYTCCSLFPLLESWNANGKTENLCNFSFVLDLCLSRSKHFFMPGQLRASVMDHLASSYQQFYVAIEYISKKIVQCQSSIIPVDFFCRCAARSQVQDCQQIDWSGSANGIGCI